MVTALRGQLVDTLHFWQRRIHPNGLWPKLVRSYSEVSGGPLKEENESAPIMVHHKGRSCPIGFVGPQTGPGATKRAVGPSAVAGCTPVLGARTLPS